MARLVFVCAFFALIFVGLVYGRPKATNPVPNGPGEEPGSVTAKTTPLNTASNMNTLEPTRRPTAPPTPTRPKTRAATRPRTLPTNPHRLPTAAAGGGGFVDVNVRDHGKSDNKAPGPEDSLNDVTDYIDKVLRIPAMRKRRSLMSEDAQEENVAPEEEKREASRDDDSELEFHLTTEIPIQDAQVFPRAIISASNLMADGQFDETIMIYPESRREEAMSMVDHNEHEEKEENEASREKTLSKQSVLNSETSPHKKADLEMKRSSTQQQGVETKADVTRSKKLEKPSRKGAALDETSKQNDVLLSKKELFMADETPEKPALPAEDVREEKAENDDDNQLEMTDNKRNLKLANEALSDEVDELNELKREDNWENKKSPRGGEIKYEVDENPEDERLSKRKENKELKMKLDKLLKKKKILA